jgi:ABC-type phosphate transport system substrate-binding protein
LRHIIQSHNIKIIQPTSLLSTMTMMLLFLTLLQTTTLQIITAQQPPLTTSSIGTGASFPANLYNALSFAFKTDTNYTITFTSLTSTKGKCRLKGYSTTCPSGDTDEPHNPDWLGITSIFTSADYNTNPELRSFPSFAGGVVAVYNLPGIPNLVLNRSVIARIFRQCDPTKTCPPGWISNWNHPEIIELNPQYETQLTTAGTIKVVVWADKAGTTENFKSSLALWDSGFATQFVGQLNDGIIWPNVSVIRANTNRGVSSRVLVTPSSIGYVSLDEAVASGLSHVGLAKSFLSSDGILRASTISVEAGLTEKGLNWGNNGDDPTHLTANAYGAIGSEAWPIVGFTYFGIKNDTSDLDCSRRVVTYSWFEWFYTSTTSSSMTRALGFAPLPDEARMKVLNTIKANMFCRGIPVYTMLNNSIVKKQDIHIHVDTSPELTNAVNLYVSAYSDKPENVVIDLDTLNDKELQHGYPFENLTISYDDVIADAHDAAEAIRILPNLEALSLYQATSSHDVSGFRKMFPLAVAPFGVVYNLCDARLAVSCDPITAKVDLVLNIQVLIGIMHGIITKWNDPAIVAIQETTEQGQSLPNAPIIIVGPDETGSRLVDSIIALLSQRLPVAGSVPTFSQVVRNITVNGFRQAVSTVAATQYSLTFASGPVNVFSDKTVTRVARFWDASNTQIILGNSSAIAACVIGNSNNKDRADILPGKTSVYSQSKQPGCWPLVEVYFISSTSDYNDEECYTGVPQVTAHFMDFILKYSAPLELLGIVGIDANGLQRTELGERECFGRSITNPTVIRVAIPDQLFYVIRFFGGTTAVGMVGYLLWTYMKRDNKIIAKSPWWYLAEVAIGCAFQAASLIPLAFQEFSSQDLTLDLPLHLVNGACMLFPWLYGIGICLVYAPILSRTWKVHRIFRTSTMKEVRNNLVLEIILQVVFIFPVMLILAVWSGVDPLTWHTIVLTSDPITGQPSSIGGICACNHIEYYLSPLVGWVGLSMIIGLFFAYLNRQVSLQYKIIFNLFSLTVLMVEVLAIGIPIIILTSGNLTANFAAKAVFVIFTCLSAVWLLLFPVVSMVYHCDLFRSGKSTGSSNKDDNRSGSHHHHQHGDKKTSKSSREEGGGGTGTGTGTGAQYHVGSSSKEHVVSTGQISFVDNSNNNTTTNTTGSQRNMNSGSNTNLGGSKV